MTLVDLWLIFCRIRYFISIYRNAQRQRSQRVTTFGTYNGIKECQNGFTFVSISVCLPKQKIEQFVSLGFRSETSDLVFQFSSVGSFFNLSSPLLIVFFGFSVPFENDPVCDYIGNKRVSFLRGKKYTCHTGNFHHFT